MGKDPPLLFCLDVDVVFLLPFQWSELIDGLNSSVTLHWADVISYVRCMRTVERTDLATVGKLMSAIVGRLGWFPSEYVVPCDWGIYFRSPIRRLDSTATGYWLDVIWLIGYLLNTTGMLLILKLSNTATTDKTRRNKSKPPTPSK